jgi:hypothetical protein
VAIVIGIRKHIFEKYAIFVTVIFLTSIK